MTPFGEDSIRSVISIVGVKARPPLQRLSPNISQLTAKDPPRSSLPNQDEDIMKED